MCVDVCGVISANCHFMCKHVDVKPCIILDDDSIAMAIILLSWKINTYSRMCLQFSLHFFLVWRVRAEMENMFLHGRISYHHINLNF